MTTEDSSVQPRGLLLIVDDDAPLRERLGRAMGRKGYTVITAGSVAEAKTLVAQKPAFAIVDLRLGDGQGIEVVEHLRANANACRIIMLTGYGNIATAVAAVKAGAIDYLPKPADADAVDAALLGYGPLAMEAAEKPMTPERLKWEHIQRVFEQCDHNVSETARQLGMHRRTLQRVLSKYAPKEQDAADFAAQDGDEDKAGNE